MKTSKKKRNVNNEKIIDNLFDEIGNLIVKNKTKMIYQINNNLVNTYFTIGKIIVENEQKRNIIAIIKKIKR